MIIFNVVCCIYLSPSQYYTKPLKVSLSLLSKLLKNEIYLFFSFLMNSNLLTYHFISYYY